MARLAVVFVTALGAVSASPSAQAKPTKHEAKLLPEKALKDAAVEHRSVVVTECHNAPDLTRCEDAPFSKLPAALDKIEARAKDVAVKVAKQDIPQDEKDLKFGILSMIRNRIKALRKLHAKATTQTLDGTVWHVMRGRMYRDVAGHVVQLSNKL